MTNSIMFFIGLGIVLMYTFFLIRIITKPNNSNNKITQEIVDVLDLDGMGNQGRIPSKKPKNRA